MAGWTSSAITFPVCEEFGTRKEVFTANAFEAEVVLRTAWATRFEVVYDIYRTNQSYPDVDKCLMSGASILPTRANYVPKPAGDPKEDVIDYQEALITMKYSTLEAAADDLRIETLEPSVENLVQPFQHYQWGNETATETGTPPGRRPLEPREAPGFEVLMYDYTVRVLQQEIVPADFFDMAGGVNYMLHTTTIENVAGGAKKTFAPETMLYTPGPITRSYTLQGVSTTKKPKPGWDYTMKFKVNPYTWNKYYRADQPGITGDPSLPPAVLQHFVNIYRNTKQAGVNLPYNGYPRQHFENNLLPP